MMHPHFLHSHHNLGPALKDPLVIKVASIPSSLAASVGYRVNCPDPALRQLVTKRLNEAQITKVLRLTQIAADVKGSQYIYKSPGQEQDFARYQLTPHGDPVGGLFDRNSIGDLTTVAGGAMTSTVTRFWESLQEYYSVLGKLKRRLATVVIYSEEGLKRTLFDHDEPQQYLEEITGELYQALGATGVLAIDAAASCSVLNLDIGAVDKAITPWKQLVLAAAGGLTEDQLWGGSDRPVGLSGADEQARRAVSSIVDGITENWTPFLDYAAKQIAYQISGEWAEVTAEFNPYDNPSLQESLTAQKLAAEADKIAIENGVLTVDEVRASRHGGDGFGVDITLGSEPGGPPLPIGSVVDLFK